MADYKIEPINLRNWNNKNVTFDVSDVKGKVQDNTLAKIQNNEFGAIEEIALDNLFETGISFTKADALSEETISRDKIHNFNSWKGDIEFIDKGDGAYLITKDGIAMGWTDQNGKEAYENVINATSTNTETGTGAPNIKNQDITHPSEIGEGSSSVALNTEPYSKDLYLGARAEQISNQLSGNWEISQEDLEIIKKNVNIDNCTVKKIWFSGNETGYQIEGKSPKGEEFCECVKINNSTGEFKYDDVMLNYLDSFIRENTN